MVTIGRSPMRETGTTQERVATPPTCTVQAPQAAMPQPYLVPVIFRSSRRTHSSGVPGSTVTACGSPFTVSVYVSMTTSGFSDVGDRGCQLRPMCVWRRRIARASAVARSAVCRQFGGRAGRPKGPEALLRGASRHLVHQDYYFLNDQ